MSHPAMRYKRILVRVIPNISGLRITIILIKNDAELQKRAVSVNNLNIFSVMRRKFPDHPTTSVPDDFSQCPTNGQLVIHGTLLLSPYATTVSATVVR